MEEIMRSYTTFFNALFIASFLLHGQQLFANQVKEEGLLIRRKIFTWTFWANTALIVFCHYSWMEYAWEMLPATYLPYAIYLVCSGNNPKTQSVREISGVLLCSFAFMLMMGDFETFASIIIGTSVLFIATIHGLEEHQEHRELKAKPA